MTAVRIGALACLTMSLPAHAKNVEPRITIYLQESHTVPFEILARGQMTASQVYSTIQVHLEWRQGVEPSGVKSGETIGVRFDGWVPETFHPGALAYSTPYGSSGTGIHVLFERVLTMGGTPRLTGVLLGHVMAHEITHVLEGIARHSDKGVMKAHWDDHDVEQMAVRPLSFESADVDLIHTGIRKRVASQVTVHTSIASGDADVPIKLISGHILVDQVYVNGAGPFRFLLDTGAETSFVRADFAGMARLTANYSIEINSPSGVRRLPAGTAQKIMLAGHSAVRIELVVDDLFGPRRIDPDVQGVLGQNFLAQFDYLLDFQKGILSFDTIPGRAEREKVPFERRSVCMAVRAGSLLLLLDSGTSDVILFHDLKELRSTRSNLRLQTAEKTSELRVATLPLLRIGRTTLRDLPIVIVPKENAPADGLLPLTLFKSVYVNNKSGYLVLD